VGKKKRSPIRQVEKNINRLDYLVKKEKKKEGGRGALEPTPGVSSTRSYGKRGEGRKVPPGVVPVVLPH